MFAVNLGKLNINEAELKAYIYQQLNDIQPYVGEAPIAIKMTYTDDEEFLVKIMADHEVGEIEAQGSHTDVYSAIQQAKTALIRSFSAIDDEVETEAHEKRDEEIQSIIKSNKNYIH